MDRQNEGRIEPIDENERQTGGISEFSRLNEEPKLGRFPEDPAQVDGEFVPSLGSRESRDIVKLRYDLIPPDFLEFLARIFTYGAAKYDDNNWMKGLNASELYACATRHMQKWWAGENLDWDDPVSGQKGSGLPHLWHALWNVGVMAYFERHRPDLDDRGVNEPRLVANIFPGDESLAYSPFAPVFTVEVQLPANGSNEGFIFAQQGDERTTIEQARAVLQALRDDGYHNRVIRIVKTAARVVEFTDGTFEVDGKMDEVIQTVFPGDPKVTA